MLKWQKYIMLAVVVCCFAEFVGGNLSDLCESNDDCIEKDNERCVQDVLCKKGICMCKEGYWVYSSKGSHECIKFKEIGDTCDSQRKVCGPGRGCFRCPEDQADASVKPKCLSKPGGAPAASAINVSLVIAFMVAAVYTAN